MQNQNDSKLTSENHQPGIHLSSVQQLIDKLFRYKWIGLLVFFLCLFPVALLLIGQTGLAEFLPDKISYRGDSWWELALGVALIAVIVIFTVACIVRTATNRQFIWLIVLLTFFPLAFFYLLLGRTSHRSTWS
ncbi:MAG: hypothetical protein KTR33_12240 [Gammaproteobacteria bacterium]|nr:hypothetical protein [Gammaproteobacteria bacterium]